LGVLESFRYSSISIVLFWYPFYTRSGEDFQTILEDVLKESPISNKTIYSDLNFMLLSLIVSKTTNLCLDQAIQTLVLNPLGLKDTTYPPIPSLCVATEYGNRIEKHMVHDLRLTFDGWRGETTPIKSSCNDGNSHYYFHGVSGHAGFTGTYLYVNPERDMVITILTNRLHTRTVRNINPIRLEIVGRLLGS